MTILLWFTLALGVIGSALMVPAVVILWLVDDLLNWISARL